MTYAITSLLVILVSILIASVLFPERRRDRRPKPWQDTLTRTGKRKWRNV